MSARKPARRTSGVVVQALGGEVVVYDLDRHRAHSLEPRAAAIWNACDGKTTVAGIARAASGEGLALDEAIVRVVLERLDRAHLLAEPMVREDEPARPRREILRRAAALGGFSVLTVAVPTAAFSASCLPSGSCVVWTCTDLRTGRRCCNGCHLVAAEPCVPNDWRYLWRCS
ncbi:MAG TPA: PqqD family protein [Vicinamibacteria bacterium]|nr:PqqD family protein [Vicinamibacteria bacterium]